MFDFWAPSISDKAWVKDLIFSAGREGCEYTFGNIFCWSEVYGSEITRYGDFFFSKSGSGIYCFPAGSGDLKTCLNEMRRDAEQRGNPFRMFGLTERDKERLEELFPGSFTLKEDRNLFDYIYRTSDLSELAGKKYHAKRNHIAAFLKDTQWIYEEIGEQNISECLVMNELWAIKNSNKDPKGIAREQIALKRALKNFAELEMKGALIRTESGVVGFTVGEAASGNMFCTHFEKAFSDVRGAYPVINREFAANTISGFTFVNRENDEGDEGLRKAKLSYHPDKLLIKYTAEYND
ncbi:MAG: phosphatidylglycerol lysyltransferase domain-containing protein [Oscillospiraceae bacterium]|nr:phosphatidylglycerol lysyltransferase domain-containing protein [Oscillospiraceae bacterium]